MVFHVLNRGVGRRKIFYKERDYAAFERILESTLEIVPLRLLSYCLMPNHWHLLLWPGKDGELARFMQRLTITHVRRWQEHYHESGWGHLYQGRFKSFPVQEDGHFLTVARYVERNALRANRVEKAEQWQWSSLWRRQSGSPEERRILSEWPVARPSDWLARVNRPQTQAELDALHTSISRGQPFGSEEWQQRIARQLGLESSFRPRGRPRKAEAKGTVK
jgi:putative transposase